MDASKQVASTVALRHLGYEVTIRTSGTIVRQIVEDAPAADVLELDDVVVAVDGETVDEPDGLGEELQVGGPGATHVLPVERPAGSTNRIELESGTVAAPGGAGRAVIGVIPEERLPAIDLTTTK